VTACVRSFGLLFGRRFGDRVVLFDGQGREATAEITALDSAAVRLQILQEAVTPPLRARITLAQAIPKGKNMDLIVQKSVEIGATAGSSFRRSFPFDEAYSCQPS